MASLRDPITALLAVADAAGFDERPSLRMPVHETGVDVFTNGCAAIGRQDPMGDVRDFESLLQIYT